MSCIGLPTKMRAYTGASGIKDGACRLTNYTVKILWNASHAGNLLRFHRWESAKPRYRSTKIQGSKRQKTRHVTTYQYRPESGVTQWARDNTRKDGICSLRRSVCWVQKSSDRKQPLSLRTRDHPNCQILSEVKDCKWLADSGRRVAGQNLQDIRQESEKQTLTNRLEYCWGGDCTPVT